ncbi:MAG TPA: NADH-quinone oxidoreductase subunit H [Candidatus Omnitrophota bacterium]|nr:NADH-quinone oxidoreductase subunit H [Candidatus Omnitrophota bacterium]HQO58983.1 NADH-quinone oxidoreductase subunit H [Candidatus Omnitrophota bacterium]HQP12411.1 NADH-quinone oxidoreductase subunit H [Candidatus Omnitrophota bacterium]
MPIKIIQLTIVLAFAPFLFGVINRTKAFFAGRHGSPLLQPYYDIFKLLQKGAVYSRTTTGVFIAGPMVSLSALIAAACLVPFAGHPSLIQFDGDIILFIYLLGLARFFTVLAALDTGSSFEGMGASREVQFALFAEPALFLSLAALARVTGRLSFSGIFSPEVMNSWSVYGPVVFLVLGALFIIFLAENCRIPVDDPNTHLELTMIHEVMVLDHGGVDLAYILYAAAIKFWLLGTLLAGMFLGTFSRGWMIDSVLFVLTMVLLAVIVGVVESTLARLRLLKVPHFLIIALALSAVALILTVRV